MSSAAGCLDGFHHRLLGGIDTITVRADDDFGEDDTHTVFIEVRHANSTSLCSSWTLTVLGNTTASVQTCNP